MASYQLCRAQDQSIIVANLELADTFWTRLRGLQLRRLAPNAGLLIVPCRSVHTCFMLEPIDVVVLDRTGKVVQVTSRLKPWRSSTGPREGYAVLELPAGSCTLGVGDQVNVVGDGRAAHYFQRP